MSKFELAIYLIFAYLPIVSAIVGMILLIIGAILKYKGLSIYKKLFIAGGISFAIFLICLVAIIAMGVIGVGPGMSD